MNHTEGLFVRPISEDRRTVYVAADPTQPGAAWAMCVDDPRWVKETAKDIAAWIRQGATVMRVTPEVAGEMIVKWVRPKKKQRAAKTAALLSRT
jgi:hypothetical protein